MLALCVLRAVSDLGPVHGYAIARRLADENLGTIGGGTLYPLLSRLDRDGLVATEWVPGESGPAKKVYVITPAGEALLQAESAQWTAFTRVTLAALHPEENTRDDGRHQPREGRDAR